MEVKDFIVTPIILIVLFFLGLYWRSNVRNTHLRKYFFPALILKVGGAIALGVVYQYYYNGGDTFGFHTHGSRLIWEAFMESPSRGLSIIFGSSTEYSAETLQYTSKMWYFGDPPSFFVVRIAGLLDLLTFSTYSATAVLFGFISFTGLWAMFNTFYRYYPHLHLKLAIAIFFIPSVFFWGSGIMKDTLIIAALGWAIYCFDQIAFRTFSIRLAVGFLFCLFLIYEIKVFLLFSFLPALLMWYVVSYITMIRSMIVRILIFPIIIIATLVLSFFSIQKLGEDSTRYSLGNIITTAEITAKDNSMWTVREGGSSYVLGDYDFSTIGLVQKFGPAVWTTLFRPYPWEIQSPIMLLASAESLFLLATTLFMVFGTSIRNLIQRISDPRIIFALIFTISSGFAIGVASGNFGSLTRYRIVILPFFLILVFVLSSVRGSKKRKEVPAVGAHRK